MVMQGGIIDHYLINATALGPVTGDGDQERSPTRVVKVTPLTNNADPSLASEPLMLETWDRDRCKTPLEEPYVRKGHTTDNADPSLASEPLMSIELEEYEYYNCRQRRS